MITAPRQIIVLGLMLALVIATAAALSARPARHGSVDVGAPSRAKPVATISPGEFERRWNADADPGNRA